MNTPIFEFNEFYLHLMSLWKAYRLVKLELPALLFHYTSSTGLIGIVEKKCLWASNVEFLNDHSEPSHALKVIRESFETAKAGLPASSALRALMDGFWEFRRSQFNPGVYAFCFCEHGDLLNQWQGYGSHGRGYSIGFGSSDIEKLATSGESLFLVRIIYDVEQQRSIATKVFEDLAEQFDSLDVHYQKYGQPGLSRPYELYFNFFRNQLLSEVIRLCARFKSPAFSTENEWRLVKFTDSSADIKYRVAGTTIVPYLELAADTLNPNAIDRLVIGPTLNKETSRKGAASLFKHFRDYEPEIEESSVPFRLP